jgi:hypothetical protein
MKKVLLTAVIALSTLVASAQFMVVTTYDNGDAVEGMESVTNNLGLGYMVSDAITVGLAMNAEVEGEDRVYDLWIRYNIAQVEGAYASLQMPTSDGSEDMQIGVGFSFNVWNELYVEPNYTMQTSEDAVTGKREGSFNFGVAYRF